MHTPKARSIVGKLIATLIAAGTNVPDSQTSKTFELLDVIGCFAYQKYILVENFTLSPFSIDLKKGRAHVFSNYLVSNRNFSARCKFVKTPAFGDDSPEKTASQQVAKPLASAPSTRIAIALGGCLAKYFAPKAAT